MSIRTTATVNIRELEVLNTNGNGSCLVEGTGVINVTVRYDVRAIWSLNYLMDMELIKNNTWYITLSYTTFTEHGQICCFQR